jgi:hypothetical protein
MTLHRALREVYKYCCRLLELTVQLVEMVSELLQEMMESMMQCLRQEAVLWKVDKTQI